MSVSLCSPPRADSRPSHPRADRDGDPHVPCLRSCVSSRACSRRTMRRSGCARARGVRIVETAGLRVSEAGRDQRARLRRDRGASSGACASRLRLADRIRTDQVGKDLVAVFVPNSPNPLSGSVFFSPPTGSVPRGIARVRDSLFEAMRNGIRNAAGRSLRGRPAPAVSLAHRSQPHHIPFRERRHTSRNL